MMRKHLSWGSLALFTLGAAWVVGCEASVVSIGPGSDASTDGSTDGSTGSTTDAATADGAQKSDAALDGGGGGHACPGAKEGDPCSTEGQSCSPSPCTDPCQFCNSLTCSNGKWQGMEAFPMACFPCGGKKCLPTEYCLAFHAGVALADGGSAPVAYSCELLANCGPGCTCASASAKGKGQCDPGSCDATGGGPTVQCYGL